MYGVTILTSHPVSLWQVFITGHFLSIAPVVRSFDNAIHPIPVYSAVRFVITYPLDSNLSVGWRYPPFISWALSSIFSPPLSLSPPPPPPGGKIGDRREKLLERQGKRDLRLASGSHLFYSSMPRMYACARRAKQELSRGVVLFRQTQTNSAHIFL